MDLFALLDPSNYVQHYLKKYSIMKLCIEYNGDTIIEVSMLTFSLENISKNEVKPKDEIIHNHFKVYMCC